MNLRNPWYDPLTMLNAADHIAERYEYTPYGERTVYLYNAWRGVRGDMDGDGDVDAFDVSPFEAALANMGSYHTTYPDLDGHARGDFNNDGVVDAGDVAGFSALLSGGGDKLEAAPTLRSQRNANGVTLNEFGHQGLMHDEEIGLIHNRARTLHPGQRRFMQRDPLGYVDGMGLYTYLRGAPVSRLDPSGESDIGPNPAAGIKASPPKALPFTVMMPLIDRLSGICERAGKCASCPSVEQCKREAYGIAGKYWRAVNQMRTGLSMTPGNNTYFKCEETSNRVLTAINGRYGCWVVETGRWTGRVGGRTHIFAVIAQRCCPSQRWAQTLLDPWAWIWALRENQDNRGLLTPRGKPPEEEAPWKSDRDCGNLMGVIPSCPAPSCLPDDPTFYGL